MKLKVGIISLILLMVVTISIGFVSSTWKYSTEIASQESTADVSVGKFKFSEYLPNPEGDSAEEATNAIVDGQNGFNNPDSALNEAIELQEFFGHDSFSSVDIWHKNQMKEELGLDDNTNFLIELIDDNTRYIYTTTVVMGKRTTLVSAEEKYFPDNEYIYPIYKTLSRLNQETGQWEAEDAQIGSALPGYYKNNIIITSIDTPLFDSSTWVAGYKGQSQDDPIYVYKGQIVDAVTEGKPVYYKFVGDSNKAVNISVLEGLDTATLTVFNSNMKKVKTINGTSNPSRNVSWNMKKNNVYYIEIQNGQNVKFEIK